MRIQKALWASLLLQATAHASLDTAAQRLASVTGGIAQLCPTTYEQATCLRVDGSIVQAAGVIDKALPTLVSGSWRDGPENGFSGDVPQESAVLHLVPRGDDQTLVVLQRKGAAAPPISPAPASADGGVTIENPEQVYLVVLDSSKNPVRDLTTVRNGAYTVVYSAYGRKTQIQQMQVGAEGLKKLTAPRLAVATARSMAGGLALPSAPGYIFLVYTAGGILVTDLSDLQPGYYDVFSYRDSAAGPLAGSQVVQAGQVTRPQFNGTFTGSSTTMPTVNYSSPSPVPTPTYQAPTVPSGGQCWVNGYRRSNGTYVSGYYRRC